MSEIRNGVASLLLSDPQGTSASAEVFPPSGNWPATDEMPDEPRPTAAYYRQIAGQIRAFAQEVSLSEVYRELLDLAERFERMASFVEKRYPNRRGFLPLDGEADDK